MKYLIPFAFLVLAAFTVSAQKEIATKRIDTSLFNEVESTYYKQIKKHCRGCSRFPPGTLIGNKKAQKRFDEFTGKVDSCKLQGLAPEAVYSDTGTLAFLTMLTTSTSNYSGFRAYWVIYPDVNHPDSGSNLVPDDQNNKLALVFVPTFQHQDTDPYADYHKDDTTNCVVIKGNTIQQVSPRFVKMWMARAENQVLQCMDANGKQQWGSKYQETRSLWYDIDFIKPQPQPFNNGLIDIVKCRMNCDCKSIHAKFGGFTSGSNHHQLCAIFMIGSDPANHLVPFNTFVSLWAPDLSDFDKNQFRAAFNAAAGSSGGSDTGKPCPPPSPCGDNEGALLSSPN